MGDTDGQIITQAKHIKEDGAIVQDPRISAECYFVKDNATGGWLSVTQNPEGVWEKGRAWTIFAPERELIFVGRMQPKGTVTT